jgi:uncharacterized protein with HEPN domain
MYARALFDIIHTSGDHILKLLLALEGGADELFASTNTLAVIEDHLYNVANTLAHLPPVVMLRLPQVDWSGWAAAYDALRHQTEPRRDIVWYAVCSLLPATLVLLDKLREQEPEWFEIHY